MVRTIHLCDGDRAVLKQVPAWRLVDPALYLYIALWLHALYRVLS